MGQTDSVITSYAPRRRVRCTTTPASIGTHAPQCGLDTGLPARPVSAAPIFAKPCRRKQGRRHAQHHHPLLTPSTPAGPSVRRVRGSLFPAPLQSVYTYLPASNARAGMRGHVHVDVAQGKVGKNSQDDKSLPVSIFVDVWSVRILRVSICGSCLPACWDTYTLQSISLAAITTIGLRRTLRTVRSDGL